jgi:hypothetical protein
MTACQQKEILRFAKNVAKGYRRHILDHIFREIQFDDGLMDGLERLDEFAKTKAEWLELCGEIDRAIKAEMGLSRKKGGIARFLTL